MLRALALVLVLAPVADAAAAEQPNSPAQNPQPAQPMSVSPGSGIPFSGVSGALPFDTGDYLLGDVQGLTRARGFFTMEFPNAAGSSSVPRNANSGLCFRQFGLRRR
jgi:hypothetical protein